MSVCVNPWKPLSDITSRHDTARATYAHIIYHSYSLPPPSAPARGRTRRLARGGRRHGSLEHPSLLRLVELEWALHPRLSAFLERSALSSFFLLPWRSASRAAVLPWHAPDCPLRSAGRAQQGFGDYARRLDYRKAFLWGTATGHRQVARPLRQRLHHRDRDHLLDPARDLPRHPSLTRDCPKLRVRKTEACARSKGLARLSLCPTPPRRNCSTTTTRSPARSTSAFR